MTHLSLLQHGEMARRGDRLSGRERFKTFPGKGKKKKKLWGKKLQKRKRQHLYCERVCVHVGFCFLLLTKNVNQQTDAPQPGTLCIWITQPQMRTRQSERLTPAQTQIANSSISSAALRATVFRGSLAAETCAFKGAICKNFSLKHKSTACDYIVSNTSMYI